MATAMATIKDLSAACGLSVSTVSKALNDYPDVGEETKQLVRKFAAELGYRPNGIARSLKLGRTFNLGVVFSDDTESGFMHSYFAPVLQSFRMEGARQGYDITLITPHVGQTSMTYLEHCQTRRVDGVCIICAHFSDPEITQLIEGNLPVVIIDYVSNGCMCVMSDNRQGMSDLTRYVLSMGHRRVAYVTGDDNPVTTLRRATFLSTMHDAGITVPDAAIVQGRYHDPSATAEAVRALFTLRTKPTCILMPDDYAAIGGMNVIRDMGLRIPEDISVTGYDGVRLLKLCTPRLTTVEQDTERIGSEAANRLIRLIEHPKTTCPEILNVPSRLFVGDTVRDIHCDSPLSRER